MKENFLNHLHYLSKKEIELLNQASFQEPTQGLYLDQEKISSQEIKSIFPYLKPHPFVENAFIYKKNQNTPGAHYLFDLGAYILFEPCAMMANYFLHPTKEDLYLDACAAPGGKSLHASFLMQNEGMIVSNERSYSRALTLSSQVEKYGRKNIIVTNNDFLSFPDNYKNTFTKILLDAPCSGSAMFRKDKKMEEDWSYEKVLKLASIQKEMILKAYDFLAPGGKLLYSTCSFSEEEDEDVIRYLLTKKDAELIPLVNSPSFYEGTLKGTIHLFPFLFEGEGHFFGLIQKPLKEERNYLKKQKSIPMPSFIFPFDGYVYENQKRYTLCSFQEEISYLKVIRKGLILGSYDKKLGFIYDHAISRYSKILPYSLPIPVEDMQSYLAGNPLKLEAPDGYAILSYKKLPFAITKIHQGIAKNHYPKGLRKNYEKKEF